MLWVRLVLKERAFPCTLGTFSINEYFLVLWARLVLKERVFPGTLGTFSVKERVYLLVLWCNSYNAVEREREREHFLILWVRLVLKRECVY
jgi:hypothetical protein